MSAINLIIRRLSLTALMSASFFPANGETEAEMRAAIASSGIPVAGIYRATEGEEAVAVIPSGNGGELLLKVVEARTPAVRPGTVMGRMRPAGEPDTYVGELFTKVDGADLTSPKKFTFKASDDSRLLILPKRGKLRIRLWKLLPYMFRAPLTVDRQGAEAANEGLLRVWPQSPSSPPPIPRAR